MTRRNWRAVLAGWVCVLALLAGSGNLLALSGGETSGGESDAAVSAATGVVSVGEAKPMPREVQFSGVLQDAAGMPITGVQGVTFALYTEQSGGAPLWLETQNVTADEQGRYSVLLGAMRADGLPQEVFTSNEARWLGVRVNQPGAVEQARVLLVSVPYALKAADAETLGGLPVSAFVLSADALTTRVEKSGGLTSAAATDGLPTAAAGTSGQIAKFHVDGSTLVDSVMTESGGNIGVDNAAPETKLDVGGTIRAVLGAAAPFGTYLMPTGGAANSFRFGFGNNLYFDGGNWRTKGDGVNNAGSAILTDIGLGHLQVFALPSTGATDQVVSNASLNSFEKLRVRGSGSPVLEVFGTIGTSLTPTAPYGTYVMPTGGAANGFRFGFGNNLYFDGSNWRTKGDGANNAGSAILTDIGLGHLQIVTLPPTGGVDQVIANASLDSFEKLRISASGNVGIGITSPTAKLDVVGTAKATLFDGSGANLTNLPATALTGGITGMIVQSNATSPNIIGGHSANSVTAGAVGATISGGGATGSTNRVTDDYGTVGGGGNNQAGDNTEPSTDRTFATVSGGSTNTASGQYATVPGGLSNTALGAYSLAAGRRGKANHDGAFVWADSTNADFASAGLNQFLVRATGGAEFSGYTGSMNLKITADTDNLTETDQPSLTLSQDGATVLGHLGMFDGLNALVLYHALADASADLQLGAGNRKTDLHIEGANGRVGIGTTTPDTSLHVLGPDNDGTSATFKITSSAGPQSMIMDGNEIDSDSTMHLNFNNTNNVTLGVGGGSVGIGDTTPVDKLDVDGDIRVGTGTTGCVKDSDGTVLTGTCVSDLRFKRNVVPFAASLEKVAALQPVYFDWRAEEFPERHFGTGPSFGLIAQEVESVLPELVTEDERGYKAVKYNLLPLLNTQAIGELKVEKDAEIEQLRNEVEQLRAVVEALQERLGVEVSKTVMSNE